MRILDNDSDRVLDDVLVLLTKAEAADMRDTLAQLIRDGKFDHEHVLDHDDFNRQITLALYDDSDSENNAYYAPRVIELIKNGK